MRSLNLRGAIYCRGSQGLLKHPRRPPGDPAGSRPRDTQARSGLARFKCNCLRARTPRREEEGRQPRGREGSPSSKNRGRYAKKSVAYFALKQLNIHSPPPPIFLYCLLVKPNWKPLGKETQRCRENCIDVFYIRKPTGKETQRG